MTGRGQCFPETRKSSRLGKKVDYREKSYEKLGPQGSKRNLARYTQVLNYFKIKYIKPIHAL